MNKECDGCKSVDCKYCKHNSADLSESTETVGSVAENCTWKPDYDFYNSDTTYITGCGKDFTLNSGNLVENNFKFCPHCGGKIKQ